MSLLNLINVYLKLKQIFENEEINNKVIELFLPYIYYVTFYVQSENIDTENITDLKNLEILNKIITDNIKLE